MKVNCQELKSGRLYDLYVMY